MTHGSPQHRRRHIEDCRHVKPPKYIQALHPREQREASLPALIKDRCLFPNDASYVADVVRQHASSALLITLVPTRRTNSASRSWGKPAVIFP